MASEKDFERKVKQYLTDHHIWWLKTYSNGVQRAGIPDILACCNGYFLAIELKAEKGHASDLQMHEISQIRDASGIAIVLYPDQFNLLKEYIALLYENQHYGVWCAQDRDFNKR